MATAVIPLSESSEIIIANGSSLSAALNASGRVLVGIYMPAAWTTAGLAFEGALTEDGTYVPIQTAGAE